APILHSDPQPPPPRITPAPNPPPPITPPPAEKRARLNRREPIPFVLTPEPQIPCAAAKTVTPASVPWFLSWPGLLLERTERKKPNFPGQNRVKCRGTQGNAGGRTASLQCRTPGLTRSEQQAFVKLRLMRAGNVG